MLGTLLNTLIPGLTQTVGVALAYVEAGLTLALPFVYTGAIGLVNGLLNGLLSGF